MSDPQVASHPECVPELLKLGERLSEARRQKGLSPSDLAERLHLGTDQLVALEAGDRTRLKEPVFVIAQAKRVAGALGVDIDAELDELRHSELMRPPPRPHPRLAAPAPPSGGAPERAVMRGTQPRSGPSVRILAAVGGLVLVAAGVGWALLRGGVLPGGWAGFGGSPAEPGSIGSTRRPVDQAGNPPSPAGGPGGREDPAPDGGAGPSAAGSSATASVSAGATASPSAGSELVLRSDEPSWIAVRTSEGTNLFEGTLKGEKRFPLGKGLQVRAGRPDLVRASVGDEPAAALGPIDRIRWFSFEPKP